MFITNNKNVEIQTNEIILFFPCNWQLANDIRETLRLVLFLFVANFSNHTPIRAEQKGVKVLDE